jgi:hypothetical protein
MASAPPEPEPITKRAVAWQKIKARAEVIHKSDLRGRVSFAKAVDWVLRTEEGAQLYNEYRGG